MRRRPPTLSFQEHSKAAKSARRRTLCGLAKPVAAISGPFLEQNASTTPRSSSAFTWVCHSANVSPVVEPGPMAMPSAPSSPITPPHSVLSRSSTSTFLARAFAARQAARNGAR